MKQDRPNWEIYERMIARLFADQIDTDLCVTPNARIVGSISNRSRQIDILIEARHDTDNTRRIIIDAKNRKRKITVNDVEAFQGLMTDVGATHGYLVAPSGFTDSSVKRAQELVSIRIIPPDFVENFDPSTWPKCKNDRCAHGRVFWDGYPEVSMKLLPIDGQSRSPAIDKAFVHYVGKCDRCGRFHVLCITCNDILPIPENDDSDFGHQCSCKLPWFWIASVEQDEKGRKSGELHLVLGTGEFQTVDRRSIS